MTRDLPRTPHGIAIQALLLAASVFLAPGVSAEQYQLVVQGEFLADSRSAKKLQPLADYLSKAIGHEIRLIAEPNPLSHWERMRKLSHYDLVMDAAHFTDYRAKHFGYHVLAKVPGALRFSIVSGPNTVILELEDLQGLPIATRASPSLGAARLANLFPDPIRKPVVLEVEDAESAVEKVLGGEAVAALIPANELARFPSLNIIATTEGAPRMAFSAAPTVDESTRDALRKALVGSSSTEAGRQMLHNTNLDGFEPASAETYDGYARLLAGTWGYQDDL